MTRPDATLGLDVVMVRCQKGFSLWSWTHGVIQRALPTSLPCSVQVPAVLRLQDQNVGGNVSESNDEVEPQPCHFVGSGVPGWHFAIRQDQLVEVPGAADVLPEVDVVNLQGVPNFKFWPNSATAPPQHPQQHLCRLQPYSILTPDPAVKAPFFCPVVHLTFGFSRQHPEVVGRP